MNPQASFAQLARDDGRGALVTLIAGTDRLGAKLLVLADGATEGTLGDDALDAEAVKVAEELMWSERSESRELSGGVTVFVDSTAPSPRLVVVGAVDFAVALCKLARAMGWRPYVIDPRGRFARPERFPHAEAVHAVWPRRGYAEIGGLDPATYLAVLTHDPKIDDEALLAALESDCGYIGAMGSRTAQAARRERLLEQGVSEEDIDRLAAPVGLDIGSLTAEETALSIVAEIVALKRGRPGGRLKYASGRIHEVGA